MTQDITALAPASVERSIDIAYIRGGYALGRTAVPFFSACVPAQQLVSLLRLPSQLPVDPAQPIEIEELFQRELNVDRVENDIVPYLKTDGRLRFFNALTVALLPLDPDRPRKVAATYSSREDIAPPGFQGMEELKVGSVTLSHPAGNDSLGYLSWNTALTMPVVLDGQHRFRAIQLLLNEVAGRLRNDLAEAHVSVLFLVLDGRAGYQADEDLTVLGACRQIFIDLNKYARTVSRARLSLLDDSDVGSLAMRSILAPGVAVDPTPVPERVAGTGRLPLGLVDWRGASAKFEAGPYLTSLLTLQDMVDHVLAVRRFDPSAHGKAREAVEALSARLELDDDAFDVGALRQQIEQAAYDERPYELPRSAARAAGSRFGEHLGARVVQPLVRLVPYARLIAALAEAGVLGTELEPWLSFNDAERRTFVEELEVDDPRASIEQAATDVKAAHPLAFQVVFQKAFVYSLNSLAAARVEVAEHWDANGLDDEPTFIAEWISRFNATLAPSVTDRSTNSPFYGAGIRTTGDIDFRKTRIRAITGFVSYSMLAPLPQWAELQRSGELDPAVIEDWVEEGWTNIRPGVRDPLSGLFSMHGRNWRNGIDDVVANLTDGGEEPEDPDDLRLAHATWQLRRVAEVAAAQAVPRQRRRTRARGAAI